MSRKSPAPSPPTREPLGFVSTLSLPMKPEDLGARAVRVRGGTSSRAVLPGPGEIARGDYPLYHYLYLASLPGESAQAAQFITFMYNGRGQRLVSREGFLPARQIARVVQIVPETDRLKQGYIAYEARG